MPSLLVVPTALQASRAARRLCDAAGGLLFGSGVTTLDALVTRLLASAGERRAVLTPLAERLLAVEAGSQAGGPFADLAPEEGLAGALASAISDLRGGEVSSSLAHQVAGALGGAAGERLDLLARALGAWEAGLARLGLLDRAGALRVAAGAVQRGLPIDDGGHLELLTLDGFTSLTSAEWTLVRALVERAGKSLFRIPHFAHDPALTGPTVRLMARVESTFDLPGERDVEIDTSSAEAQDVRAQAGEEAAGGALLAARPAALLRALGGERPGHRPLAGGEPPPPGEVLALAGAGEAGEAAVAARTAAAFMAAGVPPSEIVLFAPSPRQVAPRLAAAFAAEGVPFASGRSSPLGEAPPVVVVLDALSVAAGTRDRRVLERLAASSYLGASTLGPRLGQLLDAAGALDGRVTPMEALRRRAAGIDPGERPGEPALGQTSSGVRDDRRRWESRVRKRDELLGAANRLASLLASVEVLAGPATASAQASRLTAFLDGAGVRRQAGQGERAVSERDLAALAALEEAADDVVRALTMLGRGAERLGTAGWRRLLGLAVDRASLRAGREPAAGAVELAAFTEAPGRTARAAILTGCLAGAVPTPVPAEPILRDAERQAINDRLRRGALRLGADRRAEAFHQLVCAAAAGGERVAVLWPGPGPAGGGELAPLLAQALFGPGRKLPDPAPAPGLRDAHTPREALLAVAALARDPAREAALAALQSSGLRPRAMEALAVADVEWARREAVLGRSIPLVGEAGPGPGLERPPSPYAGSLGDAGRTQLASRLPAEWSAHQLENLARCPFRVLVTLGTGLRDPQEEGLDIDGRDEGRLFHAVLERWVRQRTARQAWPPAGSGADLEEARQLARAVFTEFERDGTVGDPSVWASRREALLTRLDALVRAEAADADEMAPLLLEHQFGGRSSVPPLELRADGETIRVQGRIDRVDAGPARFRVIDYKNSGDDKRYRDLLKAEAFGVTSFQMPLYLLAAARALPQRVASATYLLLKSAERVEASAEALGLDEPALAGAVVAAVRGVRSGLLPISSRDCGGCSFGAVCRFQGVADADREQDGEGAP